MKKIIVSLLVLFVFTVSVPLAAEAQSCGCPTRYSRSRSYRHAPRYRSYRTAGYAPRYRSNAYAPRYQAAGYSYQRPSFYRRHRNVINVAAATGGGTLLGALIGGRRGAGIGALIGAGSGALYTYKINPKRRRY